MINIPVDDTWQNISTKQEFEVLHHLNVSVLLLAVLVSFASVADGQTVEVYGRTMGPIPFKVLVATDVTKPEKLTAVKTEVYRSLQRVNELMSTYIPDSDISKFNSANSTDWQSVASETLDVVEKAIEISKLTDGAFDPTVGPAVNAWNFGPGKKPDPTVPDEATLANLKDSIGYQKIELRSNPPAIRKLNSKVKLDLSAIAKGYAVDRVGSSLKALGFNNFMVEVGGEVVTSGERSSGGPWNVAIEKPVSKDGRPKPGDMTGVLQLSGKAVATSGDYKNFVDIDGERYSHTIDPKTCRPVEHNVTLTSVVADDCMTADALATAVMVMGVEKGSELCRRLGYPLLTVSRSESEDGLPLIPHASSDYVVKTLDQLSEDAVEETPAPQAGKVEVAEGMSTNGGDSILPVFLATFAIFLLMVLGMAIGAIFNNKPVTGSCGGIANMENEDGESVCGICAKPTVDCTEKSEV
jgi:thiamine biosynthesis lipoprotein